jgi:hypothetical protein
MNWQQRLREMVLAGGALVAGGCSDSGGNAPDATFDVESCCNASSDPCCTCSGLQEPINPVACAQKNECEAEGGTWDVPTNVNPNGCSLAADAASLPEAATSDDLADVIPISCCNANYDPCCSCDGPDADLATTSDPAGCAMERSCQAEGGTWHASAMSLQPDGSTSGGTSCSFGADTDDGGAGSDG